MAERENPPGHVYTYSEQFRQVFPYYLSIGMSYDEFWNGDPELAVYYRKAEEIRNQRKNQELWLQGMYIYDALCDVAPILHAFGKKGTRARPYPKEPYPITEKDTKSAKELKERTTYKKGRARMEAWMARTNKKFEGK